MERFLQLRSRCNVKLPEVDYTIIVTSSMHPQLRKRLIALKYANLNQLITRAFIIEQFITEKEQKRSNEIGGQGPQLILADDYDSAEEEMAESSMSAEILIAAISKKKAI